MNCFPCRYPAKYDMQSIGWFFQEKMLCQDHEQKTKEFLEKQNKPRAYREPGCDDE